MSGNTKRGAAFKCSAKAFLERFICVVMDFFFFLIEFFSFCYGHSAVCCSVEGTVVLHIAPVASLGFCLSREALNSEYEC